MAKVKSKFQCHDLLDFKNELRNIVKACGKKFDVKNPFDLSQISNGQLNDSYFIEITNVANLNDEACPLELEVDFSIYCWYCGGRSEHDTNDLALGDLLEITRLFARPDKAYTYTTPGVLGVFFQDSDIEPYSGDNENIIQLRLNFTARICIDFLKNN